MQTREQQTPDNPLRHLTPAQFMALGGNAVVYIKQIDGASLAELMPDSGFMDDEEFHLVVAADGSPLMVGDTEEAVVEWLDGKSFGVVALH